MGITRGITPKKTNCVDKMEVSLTMSNLRHSQVYLRGEKTDKGPVFSILVLIWQLMMQTLLLDTLKNERTMRGSQKKNEKWTLFTQDNPEILPAQILPRLGRCKKKSTNITPMKPASSCCLFFSVN